MTNLSTDEKAERIAMMTDGLEDADAVFDLIDETITETATDSDTGDDARVNVDRSALVDDAYRHVFGIDEPETDRTNAATTTTDEIPVGGVKNTAEGVTETPDPRTNRAPPATPADRGEEPPASPGTRPTDDSRTNTSGQDGEDDIPVGGVANTASRTNASGHQHGHDADLECEFCNFEASNPSQARSHARTHADGLEECPHDGCDYQTTGGLERHLAKVHNDGHLGVGTGNMPGRTDASKGRLRRGRRIIDLG